MNRETKFTSALVFSFLFLLIGATHLFSAASEMEFFFYYLLAVSSSVVSITLIHAMRQGKNRSRQ